MQDKIPLAVYSKAAQDSTGWQLSESMPIRNAGQPDAREDLSP